ncbi:hypothetical protein [Pseudovibrio sp. Alg231-02]|uniref:hypothetical protein n=1 Tax=Pseudovibrio sp. Alg231-02 TaxID=1922223 RepID=UPI000D55528C|nr:hypothetical protein [Pseudovibrio sp. Alg231-02]
MPISNLASSPIPSSSEQVHTAPDVRPSDAQEVTQPRAEPSKDNKTGYFYAPFASDDILKMVSGTNLSRDKAGKDLRSLIVATNADKAELEIQKYQLAEKMYQEAGDLASGFNSYMADNDLSEDGFIAACGPDKFEDMLSAASDHAWRADALLRVNVISNEETGILSTLKKGEDKLYIAGHGLQGAAGITSKTSSSENGYKVAWSQDIAKELAHGGLNKSFSDIRVVSCFGADARLPTSFAPEDLAIASETKINSFLFIEVDREQAFAQYLANDLKKAGFEHPEVSGYHGAGKGYSDDTHNYQSLSTTHGEEMVRSSSVRQVFIPV